MNERPTLVNVDQVQQEAFELILFCLQILKESSNEVVGEGTHLSFRARDEGHTLASTTLSDLAPSSISKDQQVLL